MKVKISQLKDVSRKAILKYGYSDEEATKILNVLMYAQLRGNNQGVVKLIGKGIPRRSEAKTPKTVKETPVSALVDGNKTHAIIVMDHITDLAIKKAKKSGVGIAGSFNTGESTGALGYYANKVTKAGFIGIAFSSSPFQTTAPFGSNEARFCTNPMAYGIPTNKGPIILDMSTSVMAYYGLIEAKTAGRKVPEGTGFDSHGNPTTNPAVIMSGALKAIAGHKGSGLAMVVQVIAGAFVGADTYDNESDNAGNLVIAIDPSIFTPSDKFKNRVSGIVSKVKSSRKLGGVNEILLPGERGDKFTRKNMKDGVIEIEENLFVGLKKVVNE